MSARTTSKRELAAEIGSLFGDLAVQSKRSLRPLLEAEGVTMPQAILLQALERAGGRQSARELGRECHMLASTVTGVIDRLELAGHVRRERDSRDRRIVWVVLTEEGDALVERMPSFFEHLGKAFTVLPARELEQMRESLLRVLAAGENEGER
ncbi:MAG TPA: MarR family transcriptional regulator [Gaiellales bacterium]|jgi:DNA-binding MarR family transcriptional regulator|nr:MarR family transcriptional regulator [Gaiellales bacterium]